MVEGFVETGLGGRDMCASGEGETSGFCMINANGGMALHGVVLQSCK